MAFIGAFIVSWLLVILLILIACVFLFVFVPALLISIVSLVKGIKYRWPIWSRILLAISGSIVTVFLVLITIYLIWRIGYYVPPYGDESSTSEMSNQISTICDYLKYFIF